MSLEEEELGLKLVEGELMLFLAREINSETAR